MKKKILKIFNFLKLRSICQLLFNDLILSCFAFFIRTYLFRGSHTLFQCLDIVWYTPNKLLYFVK